MDELRMAALAALEKRARVLRLVLGEEMSDEAVELRQLLAEVGEDAPLLRSELEAELVQIESDLRALRKPRLVDETRSWIPWVALPIALAAGVLLGLRLAPREPTWKGEGTLPEGVILLQGPMEPERVRARVGQGLRPQVTVHGSIEVVWRSTQETGELFAWWVPQASPGWQPVLADGTLGPGLSPLSEGHVSFDPPSDGTLVLAVIPSDEDAAAVAERVRDARVATERSLGAFSLVAVDILRRP